MHVNNSIWFFESTNMCFITEYEIIFEDRVLGDNDIECKVCSLSVHLGRYKDQSVLHYHWADRGKQSFSSL